MEEMNEQPIKEVINKSFIGNSNALNCPIMNKRFKQIVQQGKIIGGYKWNYKEECYG